MLSAGWIDSARALTCPGMSRPISFLSDFGLADEFVGVVHGVLARLAPESRVIDVGHSIPRGNVRAGALALTRAIQYLPPGVLLAVVDPGVGTSRRALAAETAWGHVVGPDNGLLSPAVAMVGGAGRIVSIEADEFRIPSPGATFHGRDVFAPAAAVLASGEAVLADLGPPVDPDSVVPLLLPLPEATAGGLVTEAWWVDGFGNVELNAGPEDLRAAGLHPGSGAHPAGGGALRHRVRWVMPTGRSTRGRCSSTSTRPASWRWRPGWAGRRGAQPGGGDGGDAGGLSSSHAWTMPATAMMSRRTRTTMAVAGLTGSDTRIPMEPERSGAPGGKSGAPQRVAAPPWGGLGGYPITPRARTCPRYEPAEPWSHSRRASKRPATRDIGRRR
jgi:S-adenosylmethionine hydrolase